MGVTATFTPSLLKKPLETPYMSYVHNAAHLYYSHCNVGLLRDAKRKISKRSNVRMRYLQQYDNIKCIRMCTSSFGYGKIRRLRFSSCFVFGFRNLCAKYTYLYIYLFIHLYVLHTHNNIVYFELLSYDLCPELKIWSDIKNAHILVQGLFTESRFRCIVSLCWRIMTRLFYFITKKLYRFFFFFCFSFFNAHKYVYVCVCVCNIIYTLTLFQRPDVVRLSFYGDNAREIFFHIFSDDFENIRKVMTDDGMYGNTGTSYTLRGCKTKPHVLWVRIGLVRRLLQSGTVCSYYTHTHSFHYHAYTCTRSYESIC